MKQYLLTGLCALTLAACAGGGGAGTATLPDGTKIDLTNSPKGLVTAQTANGEFTGYNQNDSFYGAWLQNGGSRKYELRYQSENRTDPGRLPSGRVRYEGHAVRVDSITRDITHDGESRLDVDFNNRTVSGEIVWPGLRRNITLHQGNISGNTYSGTASVLGNNNGKYEGRFFGRNGGETAGLVQFDNEPGLSSAFGGIRQ